MPEGTIRPACEDDLPRIYDVWYATEVEGNPDPPPKRPTSPEFRHELAVGDLRVFERDGHVIGFAAVTIQGAYRYLAECFVDPREQTSGVGGVLLRAVLPHDGRPACTLSSKDPRALGLYIRAGMRPAWPCLYLFGRVADLRLPPVDATETVAADPHDPELARWDREISGSDRPRDHALWRGELRGRPLWFLRAGVTIGYAWVVDSVSELTATDGVSVSPAGARTPADARDCLLAAVAHAATIAPAVRVRIPGQHPAVPALIAAGLRIEDFDIYCSTDGQAPFDPLRYVPAFNSL